MQTLPANEAISGSALHPLPPSRRQPFSFNLSSNVFYQVKSQHTRCMEGKARQATANRSQAKPSQGPPLCAATDEDEDNDKGDVTPRQHLYCRLCLSHFLCLNKIRNDNQKNDAENFSRFSICSVRNGCWCRANDGIREWLCDFQLITSVLYCNPSW